MWIAAISNERIVYDMEMKTFSSGPKPPPTRNLSQIQNQLSHLQREAATRAQNQQMQSQIHPTNMQNPLTNPQTPLTNPQIPLTNPQIPLTNPQIPLTSQQNHPAPTSNQSIHSQRQPIFLQNYPSQMQNQTTTYNDLEDPFPSLDLGNSVLQFNRFDDNSSQSSDGAAPTQNIDPVTLGIQADQVCPACRRGVLLDHYSRCGILTGILLFPCGLICCYLTREKACSECKTVFS